MQTKLLIERTDDTPEVVLDAQNSIFKFEGISIPENTEKFYSPIVSWLNDYSKSPNENNTVIFRLLYYNSTSTLLFTKILKIFQKIYSSGHKVNVQWYFNPNDETVKEDGEEFANYFPMSFTLNAIKQ